jgi:hypothetical protein
MYRHSVSEQIMRWPQNRPAHEASRINQLVRPCNLQQMNCPLGQLLLANKNSINHQTKRRTTQEVSCTVPFEKTGTQLPKTLVSELGVYNIMMLKRTIKHLMQPIVRLLTWLRRSPPKRRSLVKKIQDKSLRMVS